MELDRFKNLKSIPMGYSNGALVNSEISYTLLVPYAV